MARICRRTKGSAPATVTSVKDRCSRCREPVYVDIGQPNPHPQLAELFICVECGLDDEDLRVPVASILIETAAGEWLLQAEEEDMGKHAGAPSPKAALPDGSGGGKREKPSGGKPGKS